MKEKILSVFAAIALLCGIFGTGAAYAAEENYFYFCMEYAALDEKTEKEIYMNPVKIYQNGFYDWTGEFVGFNVEINTVAEAVDAILTYYKYKDNDNEIYMTDDGKTLNYFYNDGGSYFSSFIINGSDADNPAAFYNNSFSEGLGKYGWNASEITIKCGDVFRMIFDKDIFNGGYSSPASDELVGAIADYYEACANGKTSKAADEAYSAAISGYFDETQQETLVSDLKNALKGETKNYEAKIKTISLSNSGGTLSGSVTAEIGCSVSENKTAAVMLAIFDSGNRLIYCDSKTKLLSAGSNPETFDGITAKADGTYKVKLFAWENAAASMHPISACAAETKQQ